MIAGVLDIQMRADLARIANDMNDAKRIVGGAMSHIEKSIGATEGALGHLTGGLKGLAQLAVGAFSVGKVIEFAAQVKAATLDMERSNNLLNGVLKTTRSAAGLTRQEIDELVDSLAKTTKFDDDGLKKAAAAMLRFRDIQGDTFQRALKLAPDLATALGVDIVAAAQTLGKALESPANGMKGLRAAGVSLTEQQSDLAEKLLKTGDYAGAQKIVLDALTKSVGGQASGENTGLTKATADAAKSWDDFLKSIGKTETYTGITTDFFERVSKKFKALQLEIEQGEGSVTRYLLKLANPTLFQAKGRDLIDAVEKEKKAKAAAEAGRAAQEAAQAEQKAYDEKKKREELSRKEAERQLAAYKTAIKAIQEKTAVQNLELVSNAQLSEAENDYARFLSDVTNGYLKLTPEQMKNAAIVFDLYLHTSKENAEKKEAIKLAGEYSKSVQALLGPIEEEARNLDLQIENYGLTRQQIELNIVARLEEARAMALANGATRDAIDFYEREIAARKRIAASSQQKDLLDESTRQQVDMWKTIDDTARQTFISIFDSGKSTFDRLRDALKNGLYALLYELTAKRWLINISAAASGSGVATSAFGASGGIGGASGSASNLLSMGSSLNNLFGGATAAYNTGAYMTLGSMGMEQAAMLAAQDSVFGAAGTAATLEAAGASAFMSSIGAALPYVGAALAVGSMLGLFDGGGEDPHNNPQASGYHFTLSKAGVTGAAGLASPSSFVAGPTSGAGWWGDNTALSAEQVAALNKQTALAFAQGEALALSLGLDPALADKASVISTLHGNPSNGAIAGYFSSIEQAFTALADSIAHNIIPNLTEFQASGESLAQTASRLSQEFALTNKMAALMGRDGATAFGDNNLKSRDQLVQMLGGLSGASTTLGSYYQNFHSDREREADARGGIASTLRAIGIADVPTTRDQFRALVEGQNLATEAGRAMYATLLSVSDAFAGITKSAEDAASALTTDRFRTRQDYLYAMVTGRMPAYADGGDHPGGWAIVGENGPELRNMGASRVYSNGDSKALLDTSELQAEVAALRADLRNIGATLAGTGKRTAKTLERWDSDGLPAERVLA